MSHISNEAAQAFLNRTLYEKYNTKVTEENGDLLLTVDNRIIARRKHSLGFDDRFGFDIEIAYPGKQPKTIASRLYCLILKLPLPITIQCIKGKVTVIYNKAGMPSEESRHWRLTSQLTQLSEIYKHFEYLNQLKKETLNNA